MKININENICDFKLVSSKDVKEINTTSNKISKRFTEISNAKFEEKIENNKNLNILEIEE